MPLLPIQNSLHLQSHAQTLCFPQRSSVQSEKTHFYRVPSTLQWICRTTQRKQASGAKENFPVQGVQQQVVTWRHLMKMKCKLRLTTSLSKKTISIQLLNRIKPGAISYQTCKAMQTRMMGEVSVFLHYRTPPKRQHPPHSQKKQELFWKLLNFDCVCTETHAQNSLMLKADDTTECGLSPSAPFPSQRTILFNTLEVLTARKVREEFCVKLWS